MTGIYAASISEAELKRMSKSRQVEVMKSWFRSRYDDPANCTPYDEGEYVYIYGGPFDAREELEAEFGDIVKSDAIDDLVDELEAVTSVWTHTTEYDRELYPPDDDYEFGALLSDKKPLDNLEKSLSCLRELIKQKDLMDPSLQQFQLMMIFTFCIGSLEAFLSDVFARKVFMDDKYKGRYLKAETKLSQKKILLSSFHEQPELLDQEIKNEIMSTSFHALEKISGLFKGVFSVDLGDVGDLIELIKKRHDFVHRGAKDVDGRDVKTTKKEVEDLINKIEVLCKHVYQEMPREIF